MNGKCQVFTPDKICIQMLEISEYDGTVFGKKVLENSCGDGHILSKIVDKYIQSGIENGFTISEIKIGLESDIYAFEIDNKHRLNCLTLLNDIAFNYGITDIKWQVFKSDYLRSDLCVKFDYIIGNPPYISYRDLEVNEREYIRKNFKSCSNGKFDYCYAFIEKSINDLSENGVLVYIIPNSLFKNKFAHNLREIIRDNLVSIYDYKGRRVFPNALTSSAVIKYVNGSNTLNVIYYDYNSNNVKSVLKDELGYKWIFESNMSREVDEKFLKFGDLYDCSISIATLLNRAFVVDNYMEDEKNIYVENGILEKSSVRDAVSPRNMNYNKKEKIIFPYKYLANNQLYRYSEEEICDLYPNTIKYLNMFKKLLDRRCSDKSVKWFEYGRTQALSHLNQKKLLISTIVTNEVKVYELTKSQIPYSGIYIISKNNNDLFLAKRILESEEFYSYVCSVGINASGSSLRITPRDILNFQFTERKYEEWKN